MSVRIRNLTWLALALGVAALPASAQVPQPIPGAGAWLFVDRLPGMEGRVCTARANGPLADTMLLLNNAGVPILIAGRADWSGLSGETEVGLSIDGGAPATLSAGMVNNLVLVLVSDPALVRRLRDARILDWTMPFGRFRADVTGLGGALDAILACAAALPRPAGAS